MKAKLAAGFLMAMQLVAGMRMNPAAAPDVTVYVAAGAAPFGLQAKALAGSMFAAAGVRVAWRNGIPKPDAMGGLVVGVRFDEAPARDYRPGALAVAYPFAQGSRGITVFYDRVLATARASGVEEYRVTAHVLVHEITHVLERIDRHSESGVMKAHWSRDDYAEMARTPLPFAEEDLAWIHRTVEGLRNASVGR